MERTHQKLLEMFEHQEDPPKELLALHGHYRERVSSTLKAASFSSYIKGVRNTVLARRREHVTPRRKEICEAILRKEIQELLTKGPKEYPYSYGILIRLLFDVSRAATNLSEEATATLQKLSLEELKILLTGKKGAGSSNTADKSKRVLITLAFQKRTTNAKGADEIKKEVAKRYIRREVLFLRWELAKLEEAPRKWLVEEIIHQLNRSPGERRILEGIFHQAQEHQKLGRVSEHSIEAKKIEQVSPELSNYMKGVIKEKKREVKEETARREWERKQKRSRELEELLRNGVLLLPSDTEIIDCFYNTARRTEESYFLERACIKDLSSNQKTLLGWIRNEIINKDLNVPSLDTVCANHLSTIRKHCKERIPECVRNYCQAISEREEAQYNKSGMVNYEAWGKGVEDISNSIKIELESAKRKIECVHYPEFDWLWKENTKAKKLLVKAFEKEVEMISSLLKEIELQKKQQQETECKELQHAAEKLHQKEEREALQEVIERQMEYLLKKYKRASLLKLQKLSARGHEVHSAVASVSMGISINQGLVLMPQQLLTHLIGHFPGIDLELGKSLEEMELRYAMLNWVGPHEIAHIIQDAIEEEGRDIPKEVLSYNEEDTTLIEAYFDGMAYGMILRWGTVSPQEKQESERVKSLIYGFCSAWRANLMLLQREANKQIPIRKIIRILLLGLSECDWLINNHADSKLHPLKELQNTLSSYLNELQRIQENDWDPANNTCIKLQCKEAFKKGKEQMEGFF
jgi:hypothetical protein